jgi:hypothetical protein
MTSEYKEGRGDYYLREGLREENARLRAEVERAKRVIEAAETFVISTNESKRDALVAALRDFREAK